VRAGKGRDGLARASAIDLTGNRPLARAHKGQHPAESEGLVHRVLRFKKKREATVNMN